MNIYSSEPSTTWWTLALTALAWGAVACSESSETMPSSAHDSPDSQLVDTHTVDPLDTFDSPRRRDDATPPDTSRDAPVRNRPSHDGGDTSSHRDTIAMSPTRLGYTHIRANGNRYLEGRGEIDTVEPVTLDLNGTPKWVVGTTLRGTTRWTVILEDGRAKTFALTETSDRRVNTSPARLPAETPPLVRAQRGRVQLMGLPSDSSSALTPPVPLGDNRGLASVSKQGELVLSRGSAERTRFDLDVPPDARILHDRSGQLLVLAGATERYAHGVLGDDIEASRIALVETGRPPNVVEEISLPEDRVVEGLAPIWSDIDGDGNRDVIVTTAGPDRGARIVAFDEQGQRLAEGPAIGRGFRWRHQLAVAPFGPGGELEIADIRTPHIGGTVEFYRKRGDQLEIVARLSGYSSHDIGSRNLDLAVAGDFDGDQHVELLVPSESRTRLGAVHRTDAGADTDWSLPLDAPLSTNLSTVRNSDGTMAVAAGTESGTLRIWSNTP